MIFRIFRGDAPHGVPICEQARLLWGTLEGGVQLADGGKIGTFALCLCTQAPAALDATAPEQQLTVSFYSWREWVSPVAQRNSPVCDCAGRVIFQRHVKSVDGTAKLERMEQRYRAIKFDLRRLVARGGKMHRSQLLAIALLMLLRYTTRRGER
jgi:hypothetical protein